jgi:hypothetical protein
MNSKQGVVGITAFGLGLALVACGGATGPSPTVGAVAGIEASVDGGVTATGNGPGTPLAPGTPLCPATPGAGLGPGAGSGPGAGPGPGDGLCGLACTEPVQPGPADLQEILGRTIQEEYKARMLYQSVLEDFGDGTRPFARIEQAEASHVLAVWGLLERRGWAVPASLWNPGSFPAFATVAIACEAGVTAEIEDAAFYDPYLQRTDLPKDVVNVLTNLRAASLESHLPAFQLCR